MHRLLLLRSDVCLLPGFPLIQLCSAYVARDEAGQSIRRPAFDVLAPGFTLEITALQKIDAMYRKSTGEKVTEGKTGNLESGARGAIFSESTSRITLGVQISFQRGWVAQGL